MKQENAVRVRFAPSPTGHLHIGSLRTALFNWLYAHHHGGAFLLRIEDTDIERSKKEYHDSILDVLEWIGLNSDEPTVLQSQRINEHKKVINHLLDQQKAYRCFCLPDELIARFEKKTSEDFFVTYDGFCRNRDISEVDPKKSHVVRFALPQDRNEVVFSDLIRGDVSIGLDQLDDFIIARSDGRPMYNFVVVVDDHAMRISHVIRGEDHIANTPKQILLYEACGYTVPQFAHIPLILGPSGDRLSKRNGTVSVLEYRRDGYLPEAMINYLVRLGWSHGDQEIFTKQELIKYFSLDSVGKSGAIFDREKLDWVNSVYIRQETDKEILNRIINDVQPDIKNMLSAWDRDNIIRVIPLYKDRIKTLQELVSELNLLCNGPHEYDQTVRNTWLNQEIITHLFALIELLEAQDVFYHEQLKTTIKLFAKQADIKLTNLAQPIRIALIGKTSGPGVFELLAVLGKSRSIARIHKFLGASQ